MRQFSMTESHKFDLWMDGKIVFHGSYAACKAFMDSYNDLFEGVSNNYADAARQDAAERGMALAKEHGAPV